MQGACYLSQNAHPTRRRSRCYYSCLSHEHATLGFAGCCSSTTREAGNLVENGPIAVIARAVPPASHCLPHRVQQSEPTQKVLNQRCLHIYCLFPRTIDGYMNLLQCEIGSRHASKSQPLYMPQLLNTAHRPSPDRDQVKLCLAPSSNIPGAEVGDRCPRFWLLWNTSKCDCEA